MSKNDTIQKEYDVIVIGGGPAGMMAAGTAGARGKRVLLVEKNKRLGEKLRITGGGRCNVTNDESDLRKFLSHYGKVEQFLYSSFSEFNKQHTFDFFTSRGLPLVVEANKRAFPHTHNATDVERIMEEYCKAGGVEALLGAPVEKVVIVANRVAGVVVKGKTYSCKSLVLATGGASHPETGSTGDGFRFLSDAGHAIVPPTPSIVPVAVKDAWVKSLAGISIDEMKITFFVDGKKAFLKKGKILCTHFGLSGPLILNSAKQIGDLLHEGEVTATIDIYPSLDNGSLEKLILGHFDTHKNKVLKNILKEFVPPGTSTAILSLLPESLAETKVHSVTRDERKLLVQTLKSLPVRVKGLMGFDRAVVADGELPLTEIDTRTMGSKKIPNLFVTGDLLHINRPSGGFSLQLCWTSGYVAGKNA
mgnify:CR=1 FL=1